MKKEIRISNIAKIESDVNQILKQKDRRRRLIGVELSEGNLILEFSDEPSQSAKQFVKTFSKGDKKLKKGVIRKGYGSVEEIMKRAFNQEQLKGLNDEGFEMVGVIETNKLWILFWSKA